MKTVIEMAREAGFMVVHEGEPEIGAWYECFTEQIKRFAELVRADERKKWEDQTAVEINEAVLDEREACAKVCYELPWKDMDRIPSNLAFADAIRARGQQ